MSNAKPLLHCPECQSTSVLVIDSRRRSDGRGRMRRLHCRGCGHRWNLEGDFSITQAFRRENPSRRRLSDQAVADILSSRAINHQAMARRHGVCRTTIWSIRYGQIYGSACPDLPRWGHGNGELSCLTCQHWDDGVCALGHPDPLEEGPSFANDCNTYQAHGDLAA